MVVVVIHNNQTSSPLKPLCQIKPNFTGSLLGKGGTKVYINGPVHMTKMTATAMYSKTPSKIFCSGTGRPMILKFGMQHRTTQVIQSLYIWSTSVDLDLFYGKVKFGNLGFSIGKRENWIFQKLLQPVT